jgi:tetratricopeptide (TPR) repeat protein
MTDAPDLKEAIDALQSGDLDRARAIAEREVALAPSPAGEHLLGLIHCRLGNLAQGVEHLKWAADAEPGNVAFKVMLARALVDAGRSAEVLAMPEPPAITSPAELALWHVRAEAADAAGNTEAAVGAWSRMTVAVPGDWRAWGNLGNALAAQQRWAEAGEALSKAAELNPSDLTIRRNAGSALAQAGRLEEALAAFELVAAADPNDAQNRTLLASTLAALQRHDEALAEFEAARRLGGETLATELGLGRRLVAEMRFAEAEAAFRRALAFDPANRTVVHQLGLVLERTNQLDALSKLLNDSLEGGLGQDKLSYLWAAPARREGRLEEARELLLQAPRNEDPIGWNRLKAKIADEMGNSAEAFEASVAMNRAAQEAASKVADLAEFQRASAEYRENLHQLARVITPEWAARVPLLTEPPKQRIAFLLGFPRSGTTLLDTFLMGHSEIEVLEEKQLIGRVSTIVGRIEELPSVSMETLRKARAAYFDALAEFVGSKFEGLVVDKFPLDMASAPLIQALFPRTPIIFAQRHPCDVVLSGFMQSFGMVNFSNIRDAADYYDALMSIWTASLEAMDLNVHTVVYEDFVRDPEATLKPTLVFLGLEWDERLLDHRRTAKERGAIVTPSYDQVTQPVTTRAIGRWKHYRTELEPVLPILLPWAERLGYRD